MEPLPCYEKYRGPQSGGVARFCRGTGFYCEVRFAQSFKYKFSTGEKVHSFESTSWGPSGGLS